MMMTLALASRNSSVGPPSQELPHFHEHANGKRLSVPRNRSNSRAVRNVGANARRASSQRVITE